MPSAPGRTGYVLNGAVFRGEYALGGSIMHRLGGEAPIAVTAGFSYAGNRNNAAGSEWRGNLGQYRRGGSSKDPPFFRRRRTGGDLVGRRGGSSKDPPFFRRRRTGGDLVGATRCR